MSDCEHKITEYQPVDDTNYFDADGNVRGYSNPDVLVCKECEAWQDSDGDWHYDS